VIGKKDKG